MWPYVALCNAGNDMRLDLGVANSPGDNPTTLWEVQDKSHTTVWLRIDAKELSNGNNAGHS